MRNTLFIFAVILFNSLLGFSQSLTVDQNTYTPQQLVEEILVSGCIEVSNVTYNDPSGNSIGYFNSNGANFTLSDGIIFGTMNDATDASGPNMSGTASSTINNTTGGNNMDNYIGNGDTDLHNMNGGNIAEAAILEFDFIPQSDTLKFNYTFASEEYPEYECSEFNDVFGFFLTGPNPSGGAYTAQNIALVPGSTIPVGINSVNTGGSTYIYPLSGCTPSNPYSLIEYMADCTDPTWGPNSSANSVIAIDGFTQKLTAFALVVPCQTYHIKLAIGDIGDPLYDSGIFLEAGSFSSGEGVNVEHFANNIVSTDIIEGCDNYFIFTRDDTTDVSTPLTVNYEIFGDVDIASDINNFPTTITIPAGQTSVNIPYIANNDGTAEGNETFIFTYVDGCFCSGGADTILITIHDADIPEVEITENITVCIGENVSINLFENNPNINLSDLSIIWGNASTDSVYNFTANTTQTYTANVSFGCGFDTSLSCTVSVNNCSYSIIATDFLICNGDTANISVQIIDGTAPFTYQWSNGLGTTNNPISVSPNTTTNYIITVTDALGITVIDTATVTVFDEIDAELSVTNISCFGLADGSAFVTMQDTISSYSYHWSVYSSNNQEVHQLQVGSYTVTITNEHNCTSINTVAITQPTELNLETNSTDVICFGDNNGSINISVSGGIQPYSYTWNNGETSQNINNLTGGLYTVTITDANNCTINNSIQVFSIAAPLELSYQTNNNPCFGYNQGSINTTVVGGTPPYNYNWGHNSHDSILINLYTSSYSLTVSDANNCSVNAVIPITEPNKLVSSLGEDQKICKNTDLLIQSSTQGGIAPYLYSWNTGSIFDNITINISDSTSFSITVTDANNCTASDIISINTFNLPNIYTTSNIDTVCPGDPVIITSNINADASPYTYTVNGNLANIEQTVYPHQINTYLTQVTDACGNIANSQASIYTYNIPTLAISSDILKGCPPLTVNFNEASNINNATYNWSFGNNDNNHTGVNNPIHTFSQTGIYDVSLEVTTEQNCKIQQTITGMIEVYIKPEAMFEATPELVSFINPIIEFNNYSTNNYNNYWYFGDGKMSSTASPVHEFSNIGVYNITLIVESVHGCLDSVFNQVEVKDEFTLYVPTAFSPDGDGINDSFSAIGNGIDTDNFMLRVYDRWGEIIWESSDLYQQWNGTAKNRNNIVQNGTYKWLIICKDFNGIEYTKSGNVTVIR